MRTAHDVFWAFLLPLSFSSCACLMFLVCLFICANWELFSSGMGGGVTFLRAIGFSLVHDLFMVSGLLSGACKLLTVGAELNQLWQDSMRKLTVPLLVL